MVKTKILIPKKVTQKILLANYNILRNLHLQWNKPHPFIFKTSSAILPGIITFVLLLIFQPFGLHKLANYLQIGFATITSCIVMASIFVMVFTLKKLCPTWMEEENWTFGKEVSLLLLGLLVIALGIWGIVAWRLDTALEEGEE